MINIKKLFCLSILLSFSSYAMIDNNWRPMGILSEQERSQHLQDQLERSLRKEVEKVLDETYPELLGTSQATIKKENAITNMKANKQYLEQVMVPEIHSTYLPNERGTSFSFDGTPDIKFCEALKNSNDQEITILFPGAGVGRSILDALHLNKNARIIANELYESSREDIANVIQKYGHETRNIEYLMGDILEKISSLNNDSVDMIYSANLIHFFSPYQIEKLLIEFYRVLKPNGKLFISWKGFSVDNIDLADKFYSCCQKSTKIFEKNGFPYPRFFEKNFNDRDKYLSKERPFPYYFATTNDILSHIKTGFEILDSGEEVLVSCSKRAGNDWLWLGDYKSVKFESLTNIKLCNIFHNYLILEKSVGNYNSHDFSEQFKNEITVRYEKIIKSCKTCGTYNENLKSCSACKNTYYCNISCQKADWKNHKRSCKNN